METVVNAEAIPKTLTQKILSLEVGQAMVIDARQRATALAIVYYHKNHKGKKGLRYRSRKKNENEVYIIREA